MLSPLFIGFVVAWLFAPLVDKLTKKGMSRIIASLIVYVVFIVFLIVFFRIFIPIIYNELNELIKTLEIFKLETLQPIIINGIIVLGFTLSFVLLTLMISKRKQKIG